MKRSIIYFLTIVFLLLISCDDSILKPEVEPQEGLNIQIGNSIIFTEKDIDYYDHSAHYFYFKESISERLKYLNNSKYWITSGGNVIFTGIFSFNSYCVDNDSILVFDSRTSPEFVLKPGNLFNKDKTYSVYKEYRENEVFINSLEELGLLYNGLECIIHSIKITGENEISVCYTIKNDDPWGYYFLDQEKISTDNIYNKYRFINLRSVESRMFFTTNPKYGYKFFHDGVWDISWLTLIEPNGSKMFTERFEFQEYQSPLLKGKYLLQMNIPGLNFKFSNPEERLLENGRIWLGDIELVQLVEVE